MAAGQLQKVCTEMPPGHTQPLPLGAVSAVETLSGLDSACGRGVDGARGRGPAGEAGTGSHRRLLMLNKAGAATGTGSVIISSEQRKRKAGAPTCHN